MTKTAAYVKSILNLRKRIIKVTKNEDYYLSFHSKLHPYLESGKIAVIYGALGILWLTFPEGIISRFLGTSISFREINIIKGEVFVFLSALVIFLFFIKRLLLFEGVMNKLKVNLEKQKVIEQELNQLAYYDVLTKLPNRILLEARCNELLQHKETFAFICMDVDNFKNINDTLGHLAGDRFLVYLSEQLVKYIGPDTFVARIGGDEFAIVMTSVQSREKAEKRLQYLLWALQRSWTYEGQKFQISVSMGVALYPEHGEDLTLLRRNSDIAMYAVKKRTKNNYCFYSEELSKKNTKNIMMINELHKAIENEEFQLYYQPIINLNTGRLSGVEALIRWHHPEQGIISPMDFIPLVEEAGLIHDLEKWILKTAFLQKKAWDEMAGGDPKLLMSINISGKSFVQYGFVNAIRNLLIQTGLNSNEIQLEITETVLIEKMNISKKVINDISNMGIQIALDDFGSGYSSLTYLKNLPIDVVKLDANFIKGIIKQGGDRVIVEAVTKLTHDLGLKIVAEGIETDAQLSILKENCCDYGQGYLFGKPVPAKTLDKITKSEDAISCIASVN